MGRRGVVGQGQARVGKDQARGDKGGQARNLGPGQGGGGGDGHKAGRDGTKEGDREGRAVRKPQQDAVTRGKALRGKMRWRSRGRGRVTSGVADGLIPVRVQDHQRGVVGQDLRLSRARGPPG